MRMKDLPIDGIIPEIVAALKRVNWEGNRKSLFLTKQHLIFFLYLVISSFLLRNHLNYLVE